MLLGKSLAKIGDKASSDQAISVLQQAKSLNEYIGTSEVQAATALYQKRVADIGSGLIATIDGAKKTFERELDSAQKLPQIRSTLATNFGRRV